MKQKLFLLLFTVFSITSGFSQTIANQPANIAQCGNEVFDLTQQTPIILLDQDPQYYVVSYFEEEADAISNTNPITSPQEYVGLNEQIIYARVTNLQDNTFATTQFMLIIADWQNLPVNQPTTMEVCDENGDNAVIMDLTTKISEVTDGSPNMLVTFHEVMSDAYMGINAISNTQAYSAVISFTPYMIWMRVQNITTGCYGVVGFEVVVAPCTGSTISGTLTVDAEGNGCASGGTPAAYVMVALTNDNHVRYTYTDANGNYIFINVQDGDNYITVTGQGPITYQTSPESHTVTAPGQFDDQDFCLMTPDPVTDVAVFIYPNQEPRPGFPMSYTLVLQNFGNTTENGTVTFTFDDSILTYNSTSPLMTISGNTLTYSYTNLEPYTPQYIFANFTVSTEAEISVDFVEAIAVINTPDGDVEIANNEASVTQIVVGSFDPNDIACREGESITEAQADGYLHYLIRFQNTADGPGAAEAIFVIVDQELDADLDPSTFQPVSASHDYTMRLEDGHLTVRYDDINLPPSGVDEEGSNGYFMYRIKPRSNVQLGDSFVAEASIVFDFNDPIITNNYITTIQSIAGLEENSANAFVIYPNPASHIISLQVNDIAAGKANVVIADVLGKTVMSNTIQLNGNTATLDVSSLNSGMYFVTLQAEGKQVTKKLVIE